MQLLTTHFQSLRFDWAAINTTLMLATLLALMLPLMVQLRRLRRQSTHALERIFEQLDLMRLDAMERPAPALARSSAPHTLEPLAQAHPSSAEARVLVALNRARTRQAVNS